MTTSQMSARMHTDGLGTEGAEKGSSQNVARTQSLLQPMKGKVQGSGAGTLKRTGEE